MAILQENNYIKIEYDGCMIVDSTVYVKYKIYESKTDRDKEKEREPKVADFKRGIRSYIEMLGNKIDEIAQKKGYIGNYPTSDYEFDNLITHICEVQTYEDIVLDNLYHYDTTTQSRLQIVPKKLKELFESYGYEEQWLTDTIRIKGGGLMNCGAYLGEEPTHKYFYEKLKSLMDKSYENI